MLQKFFSSGVSQIISFYLVVCQQSLLNRRTVRLESPEWPLLINVVYLFIWLDYHFDNTCHIGYNGYTMPGLAPTTKLDNCNFCLTMSLLVKQSNQWHQSIRSKQFDQFDQDAIINYRHLNAC